MKKMFFSIATIALLTSCDNKENQNESTQPSRQATLDSVEYANKQQRIIDSLKDLTTPDGSVVDNDLQNTTIPVMPASAPNPTPKNHKSNTTKPEKTESSSSAGDQVGVTNAPSSSANSPQSASTPAENKTVAVVPEKKKGLNNSAKGAIIGLGTGAAAGAIIGKENRGKGAIIGGVAGAIGGAVGGAVLDKRKAKKAVEAARKDSIRQDSIKRAK